MYPQPFFLLIRCAGSARCIKCLLKSINKGNSLLNLLFRIFFKHFGHSLDMLLRANTRAFTKSFNSPEIFKRFLQMIFFLRDSLDYMNFSKVLQCRWSVHLTFQFFWPCSSSPRPLPHSFFWNSIKRIQRFNFTVLVMLRTSLVWNSDTDLNKLCSALNLLLAGEFALLGVLLRKTHEFFLKEDILSTQAYWM